MDQLEQLHSLYSRTRRILEGVLPPGESSDRVNNGYKDNLYYVMDDDGKEPLLTWAMTCHNRWGSPVDTFPRQHHDMTCLADNESTIVSVSMTQTATLISFKNFEAIHGDTRKEVPPLPCLMPHSSLNEGEGRCDVFHWRRQAGKEGRSSRHKGS